jgi:hypothetical protein
MSRKSSQFCNEVKAKLNDRTYEGLRAYMAIHGIEYMSTALERVATLFLFGTVGTLPANLVDVSSQQAVVRNAEHA